MSNPYTNRGTIKNPQEFYGREREVRRIYSRISSSHPQCISIIGERKIGKSSLLYFITQEDTRRKWLKDTDSYIFLLMDLQERTGEMSFPTFFQFTFRALAEQLGDSFVSDFQGVDTEAEFYEAFKRIVSNLDKQGLKLILLFDEFGTITGSENFDSAFFSFLRSIANNYECAYITTSREKLQNLCRDTDISESPFFNIFAPVPLGQFTDDEARSLILTPSAQAGVKFDEDEIEFILSIAGRHPLFIQIACTALFDHRSREGGTTRKAELGSVKADFLLEADEQFEAIWRDLDEEKREVLCQIAVGDSVASQQGYLVRELQRSGYITDDPPLPFSQSFTEFLIGKHPDGHEGRTTGSGSRQPVKQTSFSKRLRNLLKRGDDGA
jgi:serine/threonine-protein kinase